MRHWPQRAQTIGLRNSRKRASLAPEVNNLAQALSDPQVRHRNMMIDLAHPQGSSAEVPGNPIKLSEVQDEEFTPPPLLGAHTREVFAEWTELNDARISEGLANGHIAEFVEPQQQEQAV